MANLSLRMLSVFLLAAFVLNITNFLYVRVNNPHRLGTYNHIYPKTASGLEVSRSPVRTRYLSLECGDQVKVSSVSRHRHNYSESDVSSDTAYYMLDKPKASAKELELCPEMPPGLGPEPEDRALLVKSLQNFEAKSNEVKPGGVYQPATCKALQTVAIIIAYRGCKGYLNSFLNVLHAFLIKQQLDYQIFIVEQTNTSQPYNRGKLLNVGYTEATRYRKDGWRCIILHEPHIVPMDSRNLYRCSWFPKQLATNVERPIKASYTPLLGGALALTPEQFLKINGFSNAYWGNDADYYDLFQRINSTCYVIENRIPLIGRYKTLRRGLALWNKSEYLTTPTPLYLLDGLTSLTYTVDKFELKRLYTYIQVNIDTDAEKYSKGNLIDQILNPTQPVTAA